MITKKDIPLDILKIIEPIAQANLDLIQFKRDDNTYYCFVESDKNSKNFFRIFIDGSKRIGNFDRSKYAFELKPSSSSNAKPAILQTSLNELGGQFQNWIKLIRDIHETPSVLDDNFVKQYAEFYYNEFKMVDEDADTSPFDPNQQDLVEVYLLSLSGAIVNSGHKLAETTKNELLSDIKIIQENLGTTTKSQVMKGITKVFGKLYKTSKSLAKEIVTEAKKHLIEKLVEFGIEYGPKILDVLNSK